MRDQAWAIKFVETEGFETFLKTNTDQWPSLPRRGETICFYGKSKKPQVFKVEDVLYYPDGANTLELPKSIVITLQKIKSEGV